MSVKPVELIKQSVSVILCTYKHVFLFVCACAGVCVCVYVCMHTAACLCECAGKTIRQCFDSHVTRRESVSGDLATRLPITPVCVIPIFNPSSRDLRVEWMTCFVGKNCFLRQVQRVVWGMKKKSFQGDTRRSGVAMNSFPICLSLR